MDVLGLRITVECYGGVSIQRRHSCEPCAEEKYTTAFMIPLLYHSVGSHGPGSCRLYFFVGIFYKFWRVCDPVDHENLIIISTHDGYFSCNRPQKIL